MNRPTPQDQARQFLETRSEYVSEASRGKMDFDWWVTDLASANPQAYKALRTAIVWALKSQSPPLMRSGLQALVALRNSDDIATIASMTTPADVGVASDANVCLDELKYRLMTWHDRLELVIDRSSFVRFVYALAEERDRAQEMENASPDNDRLNGALGWNNADISSYLGTFAGFLDTKSHSDLDYERPSWRLFAEALYFGKIYE